MALYTGMREGEICGLQWKCCDIDGGLIYAERAIAKAGGKKYITTPKTEAGKRCIPIHPALSSTLTQRKQSMVGEIQSIGITLSAEESGELYVVGNVDGRHYDPTLLSRARKLMAESFNLVGTQGRLVTFHDLRNADLSKIHRLFPPLGHLKLPFVATPPPYLPFEQVTGMLRLRVRET
ncbi:MAG: hypothetical protein Q4B54_01330 [Coriobacteriales bacterium]|nr:hypothetical protein [Coriobacteriales bacterium]